MTLDTKLWVPIFIKIINVSRLRRFGWQLIGTRLMTLHTLLLYLLMRPCERKGRVIMIKSKPFPEVFGDMTLRTCEIICPITKLLLVNRLMAADTKIFFCIWKFELFLSIYDMAGLTDCCRMLTGEGKAGSFMKATIATHLCRKLDYLPTFSRMTLRTGDSAKLFMKGLSMIRDMAGLTALFL